jgi:hypothetical protein
MTRAHIFLLNAMILRSMEDESFAGSTRPRLIRAKPVDVVMMFNNTDTSALL